MERYNPIKIEKKWREFWLKENRWQADIKGAKNPYYNLMMFPYPSAEGLHVGNLYAFTGSDIWGRYMKMRGYEVFEPIGFDAFGIHSENFAIKQGVHPRELIKKSTDNFRRQLEEIGNMYSWDNLVNTTDPAYYKWTQWLFLQLYKAGFAYHKEAPVQWCPGCQTVLANEQVIQGRCERCDSLVEARKLRQWFFKITYYAERLLDNLEKIDWSEHTKIAQRNWIGRREGALIKFLLSGTSGQEDGRHFVEAFTTRPDTLFGATYMVISPEHEILANNELQITNYKEVKKYAEDAKHKTEIERTAEDREKTGVELEGVKAINPANNEEIPIFVADYVLAEYGTGAIMAVPAHDERDMEFAKKHNLPVSDAKLVDANKIISKVNAKKIVNYRLRDWLISRQRYWGAPIPVIYCSNKCLEELRITNNELRKKDEGIQWTIINGEEVAIVPVPEEELPVGLPYLEDFRPKGSGKAPLEAVSNFVNVKCPKCDGEARRETDVFDTFLDSSWYFLRYPSTGVDDAPFDKKITKQWLPVDMYIGGQEHAVLHLMYARFITMFLHDQKLIDFEEPFSKFRAHGLLIKEGAKISKSKGNIVNPDDFIENFGADTVRAYLMFLSPLYDTGDWRDEGIRGVHRFLGRVWGLVKDNEQQTEDREQSENLEQIRHQTIKKVTEDIERLHYNTAIAALMSYLNALHGGEPSEEDIKTLLILLAPFAPYITEELWEESGEDGSIHDQKWPEFDTKIAKEYTLTIPVQVNGKVRTELQVGRDTGEKELEKMALEDRKIKEQLGDKKSKKVIVIKNKIVNIVI